MRRAVRGGMVWLAIGAVLATVGVGCSGTPSGKGESTGESLQAVADRLASAQAQLETTMASLETLAASPEDGLSANFKAYTSNLNKLDSSAKAVQKTADAMSKKGEAYLQKWDEDAAAIQNEEIRNRSQARQQEIRQQLTMTREHYEALAEGFRPLMADLRDIEAALKTDLTAGGVAAIKGPVSTAQERATTVLKRADEVMEDFRSLGVSLTAGG